MLKRKFDSSKPYRFVTYGRMSLKSQNERSPDQQIAEIDRTIQRNRLPWRSMGIYRDDGVKGAYIRKRKQFNKMLKEIESGRLKVDLILVDTTDRFARSDDLPKIRKELWEKCGVLLLTAESNFADPLSPQGKVYSVVEAMRSTEENRIKGHQVLRSKWDLALLNFWPGGPIPFGYKLKKLIKEVNGIEKVVGSKLVPDESKGCFVRMAFARTLETGEGPSKVAKFIKAQPGFPANVNLSAITVKYWLRNTIYKGVLTYAANCTGIVDDVRKVEPNEPEDICVQEGFCDPIVEPELWNIVDTILNSRKRPVVDSDDGCKLIKPVAPGFTLAYMLSGLVRCGHCGCSLRPVISGRRSKAGKKYVYYVCPRSIDGDCDNQKYLPESWLREKVVGHLKRKLFGVDNRKDGQND